MMAIDRHALILMVLLLAMGVRDAAATEPLLQRGDRLAIVGGTFVERMQGYGSFEAELQCRRPDWKLAVRNLGWSGDNVHGLARKLFDEPEDGFARLFRDLEAADPTVVMLAYGFAEASDGAEAVEAFEPGLQRLAETIEDRGVRVILMKPVAMPGVLVPNYEDAIESCRDSVETVGKRLSIPVIDLTWEPVERQVTADGLVPNRLGYEAVAEELADALVGGESCSGAAAEELVQRISEKNRLFFYHYRPQNETYLLLFRKHEQGQNAVEIEQFKPLIDEADRAIWQAAGKE